MVVLKSVGLFALILMAGFMPQCAEADLIGSDLGWQYYGGGSAYNPATPGSQTSGSFTDTGSGVGGTFIEPVNSEVEPVFNIDATGTTITFDYSVDTVAGPWATSSLSLAPTIDNGLAINLLSAGSFDSVSIDPATNMVGFDGSDLSFTDNQIQINWAGLAFDSSTIVELDVTFDTSATPEPRTWSLMLFGLLATSLLWRLKLRSC